MVFVFTLLEIFRLCHGFFGKYLPNWLPENWSLRRSLILIVRKVGILHKMRCRFNPLGGFLTKTCVNYGRWKHQRFLWIHRWVCFRHIRRKSCMTWQCNCQQAAMVSCLLGVCNGWLRCFLWWWLEWQRTSSRRSWILMGRIAIIRNEVVHYARIRPAMSVNLERACDYWANNLVFSLHNGVKPTWLPLCGCCVYHTRAWRLPKIQWKKSSFSAQRNAQLFATWPFWRG